MDYFESRENLIGKLKKVKGMVNGQGKPATEPIGLRLDETSYEMILHYLDRNKCGSISDAVRDLITYGFMEFERQQRKR